MPELDDALSGSSRYAIFAHPSPDQPPPAGGPREMIGQIKEGARDIRRGTQHLPWNRQDVFGGAAKIAVSPFAALADQAGLLLEAATRGLITKDQFKTALAALRGGKLGDQVGIDDAMRRALQKVTPDRLRQGFPLEYERWRRLKPHERSGLTPEQQAIRDEATHMSEHMGGVISEVEGGGGITQSDLESFEKRLPELRRQGVAPLFDPEKELKQPRTYEDALREQKMATDDPFQGGWPPGTREWEETEPGISYSPSGRKLIDDRKLHENNKGGFRMKPLVSAGEQRDQTASIIENLRRPRPHVVAPGERGGMQQNPALVEQRQRLQEALPTLKPSALEKIRNPASRIHGKVYIGAGTHADAYRLAAQELGVAEDDLYDEGEDGFLTTRGRFVSRQEADRIVAGGDPFSDEKMGKPFAEQPSWLQRDIKRDREFGLDSLNLPDLDEQEGLPDFTSKAVKPPPEDQP